MTCRHSADDPSCSSHPRYVKPYEEPPKPRSSDSPDAENYEIVQLQRVDEHLVLKVRYPNCKNCAYEGTKVMVILNVPEDKALMWRRIDPHFRNTSSASNAAPSPAARFPASPEGWTDAIAYARTKVKPRTR